VLIFILPDTISEGRGRLFIKIVMESEALLGGMIGSILGGIIGFAIGYPQGSESGWMFTKGKAGGIGLAVGKDKTIILSRATDP